MDPTFIVLISFVLFVGIAYRLGYRQSMVALDDKIAKIRQALLEASQAKEAATQALYEEHRHHEEIIKEIELITKRTEEQALLLRQQALQDINTMVSLRQQAAENMIERIRDAAIQRICEESTTKTIATFEAFVTDKFSTTQKEALNDMAIAQIAAQLTKRQTNVASKPKRARAKRQAQV